MEDVATCDLAPAFTPVTCNCEVRSDGGRASDGRKSLRNGTGARVKKLQYEPRVTGGRKPTFR